MSRKKILVVEDSEVNVELFREVLDLGGYEARTAMDVPEALAILESETDFALALVDIDVPGGGGVKVLEALRSRPATAGIPAIAVTAFAMSDDRQRFLDAGFDGYIPKPIRVREFLGEIEAYLLGSS